MKWPSGERVYAGTGKLPIQIIKDGAFVFKRTADLSNQTSGGNDYTRCGYLDEEFFADGRKLWNCRDVANVWRNLYLDPAENAFYDYTGQAPIDTDPRWIRKQDGTPAGTSAYTSTSYGKIFTGNTDSGVILFEDLTGAVTQIWAGDQLVLEQDIRSLVTYSNP
ncbi:MAG: hypothetical protein KAZ63_06450 [Vitreoscilla sp.]|nr:hypothetical protein [Vitreoscilla sp.]